jgi:hypothetical protein
MVGVRCNWRAAVGACGLLAALTSDPAFAVERILSPEPPRSKSEAYLAGRRDIRSRYEYACGLARQLEQDRAAELRYVDEARGRPPDEEFYSVHGDGSGVPLRVTGRLAQFHFDLVDTAWQAQRRLCDDLRDAYMRALTERLLEAALTAPPPPPREKPPVPSPDAQQPPTAPEQAPAAAEQAAAEPTPSEPAPPVHDIWNLPPPPDIPETIWTDIAATTINFWATEALMQTIVQVVATAPPAPATLPPAVPPPVAAPPVVAPAPAVQAAPPPRRAARPPRPPRRPVRTTRGPRKPPASGPRPTFQYREPAGVRCLVTGTCGVGPIGIRGR